MEEYVQDQRSYERAEANILAQYFIKSKSMRYHDCTILNISRAGLAIKFHQEEETDPGAEILMEFLLPPKLEALSLSGEITRIAEDKTVCGIMFRELLPAKAMDQLKKTWLC